MRRTLRPLGGRFRPEGWWLPARTPEGVATLYLRRNRDGVSAVAWGPGGDWLTERAPLLVGEADHPDDLVTDHPVVAPLVRRHRGYRFGATGLVFEALVRAVVAQKVAGKEAGRSLTGLRARFSGSAPGPEKLRLPPDPQQMARAPYWEYHTIGLERRRADILRRLAADHARIERLVDVDSSAVQAYLRRHRGVGVWTAAETLAVSHGDADAVSVGDYHHKNLVAWHLTGRPRGSDEEMLELLEPFRPHRGRVVRLLETLGHAPAYGSRKPLRSFEDR